MSNSQEVNQQQFNDEEEIPCGQRYPTAATIQTDHQQTGVNGSTPMFELKSTARKEYGTAISMDMALTLKTLCKVLECKATELTVTCIIPLIALLLPDHMWSEATSSDRWRYRLRNATYWISNPTRESEYQALLRWMEEKMPIPLAKWQGACLPRYGEAMSDMFLTSLYPEEIGQLMELLRTYAGVSQSECQNACTSSANTATTSTSYTPVTTPRAAADVVSYSTPLLSNYVDDDAFERMLESSNYQKETGPVSFNTYVHRPGMSKKWAASTLMEDYVVDIHIYQLVLRNFFIYLDWLTGIEANRCVSYIKTGMPGREYVKSVMPKNYWRNPKEFHLALDKLELLVKRHFGDFTCLENFLPQYRWHNCITWFVNVMCCPLDPWTVECAGCGFQHIPNVSKCELLRDYPFMNEGTINHILIECIKIYKQEGSNPECRPERLVETCLLQGSGELQSEQSIRENGQNHTAGSVSQDDQDGVQDNGSTNVFQEEEEGSQEGPRQKKSRRKQRFRMIREIDVSKPQSIEELIYRYPCCPPEAFYNIPEFYANKNINWIDMKDFKVTIPLRNWAATLRRWSIHDFNKYYNDSTVFPYFNAYGSDICNMYYSISESLTIAKQLLNYQFGDDPEVVIEFLTTLYNVIDKRIPKLNSICIKSPPSAGKNFFFDAVASYLLSYGMFGTANKNNNFSWADGAGKRLVLWNEPNYEQYHIEKIKELLGGDTTRIHVKYANDVSVQRVPIIILTNNHLNIISHPAFNDRLRSYEWMSAGFLKDYDKKLHPLMFYELLKDYGVINDNNMID